MKKSMLVLTAALTFGGLASAQTAATASAPQVPAMTDVPAGHWAKDAIDRLISKGIILGYPDGTFRGTQNLTRYEAAVIIARLLDQINAGTAPAPAGEDLVALQNAVQELAADLAALGVRVSDLEENTVSKDDFSRLEARVEELAAATGNADAVADLQAKIDDLTARADDYDTLRADVDDNASSIAALNDLTVLLNQDILDLQDRVSAVEAAQADFVQRSDFDNLSGKVTAIDTRVTTLEKAPKFSVYGSIIGTYGRIAYTRGSTSFDITRLLYGTWGAGIFDSNNTDLNAVGEMPYDYTAEASGVRFGVKVTGLTTANGKIIVNNANVNLRTANAWSILGKASTDGSIKVAEPYVFVNDANADGTIDGQKFTVVYDRRDANYKFQNYLFDDVDVNQTRRGMIATIEATKLPFSPTIKLVTGNTNSKPMLAAGQTAANYYGVSTSFKVGEGKLAVNYGQVDGNRAAAGVDADLKFGIVGIRSEAVVSVPNANPSFSTGDGSIKTAWANANKMGYVEGRVDLGMVKFGANYRAIDPGFTGDATYNTGVQDRNADGTLKVDAQGNPVWIMGSNAGMSSNDDRPYVADQKGFGVALATNLGPVALGAYFDQRTKWNGTNPVQGFGGKLGAKFGALEAVAFANSLKVNSASADGIFLGYVNSKTVVGSIDDHWLPGAGTDYNVNSVGTGMGLTKVPFEMTSTVGAQLSHDGNASNALVKNLNFTVGDGYYYLSKTNSLYAFGDYTLNAGGLTFKPIFRYHGVMNSSVKDDLHNLTVLKGGVKISTPVFTSIPLQPSLFANAVGRSTTGNVTKTQSTEVLAQAGIGLNRLFADNLTANVGYSYYAGKNVLPLLQATDTTDPYASNLDRVYSSAIAPVAFNGTTPIFNNNSVKTDGVFAQLGWNGLNVNWGLFRNTISQDTYNSTTGVTTKGTPSTTVAQAFKVNYTFRF